MALATSPVAPISLILPTFLTLEIVDATLDSVGDEKAYYLVAGKGQVDTIEVSYLNGVETPIIETGVDYNHLGVNFRMFHDFSINVLDTRGLVKNAGV